MAFTEQGIAMLSGLLRSPIAIQMNINIMRAFVVMRQALYAIAREDLHYEQINRRIDSLDHRVDNIIRNQEEHVKAQEYVNQEVGAQLEVLNDAMAALLSDTGVSEEQEAPRRIGFRTDVQ